MIRLIAFAALALAVATSAEAMSPPPLHKSDGLTTEVRYYGHGRYRGYGGYRHYGYRGYGYRGYGYRAYRPGYGCCPPPSPQVRVVGRRARLPSMGILRRRRTEPAKFRKGQR